MRCPDCGKFVSMENGEPEINTLEVERSDTTLTVAMDGRHTRNCADCGTELKSVDFDDTLEVDIKDMDEFKALTPEQQKGVLDACMADDLLDVDISEGDLSADESGGSRFKKNIITVTVGFDIAVKVPCAGVELKHSGEFKVENQASNYEECC